MGQQLQGENIIKNLKTGEKEFIIQHGQRALVGYRVLWCPIIAIVWRYFVPVTLCYKSLLVYYVIRRLLLCHKTSTLF